jgi:hypothetical protein
VFRRARRPVSPLPAGAGAAAAAAERAEGVVFAEAAADAEAAPPAAEAAPPAAEVALSGDASLPPPPRRIVTARRPARSMQA